MAAILMQNMTQLATYWAPGKNDAFGNLDFSDIIPVFFLCRWQDDAVLFRDANGQERVSDAIVYPSIEVKIQGYLARGDQTNVLNPHTLPCASEIRRVGRSPSLSGDLELFKAYL